MFEEQNIHPHAHTQKLVIASLPQMAMQKLGVVGLKGRYR
jgi:hypothetical protein